MMLPRSQEGDYGVLNLPDAINVGTANHLPTKISQEEVLLAKMKVREAKRALFPKAKIKYKTTQGTTTGEDFEGEEYAAEFQQNIYAGGKYRSLYNQARVNLAVARKNYEKTKAEFVFEVTQAYYNLAFAKAKMKHKLELYEKIKSLLEIAEKQYTAKALTLAEVLEARSQLEEARFQVREIENDLELASLALVQLLSLPRTASIDTIDIPEPIVFEIEPDELYEVGYKNRRDYQVKKLLVLFNKYGLEIARKKAGFNVELTGSYGRRDEYFISEEVDLKDEYYFGVKITRALGPHEVEINALSQDKVPQVGQTTPTEYDSSEIALKLWEQKTGTDIAEANIAYHKSLSELENSKRELVHDISSAIFSVREAEAKMENKQSAVSLASEELRSTRAKQQVDQATIVQVMRSESKWWNAKTELVSAQADYYVSIAKLNKNVGVNDYFDPAAGVVATDREGLTPGIRLMINEKSGKTPWWKKDPFAGGIPSYYPDEVVNDILREKQDEEVMGKKFLGIFKRKKDKEMAEYKSYDEKYDFSMPGEKKKKKWFFFGGKKLDDDFSRYYESREEYEDAFGIEEEEKTVSRISETAPFLSEETTETDYFEQYLEDKDRILFAQMHVEDSKYETALAIRANSKTEFTVSVLRDPYRLLVTMKDVVISALPDFEAVEKGAVESVKAFHTKTVLPSAYRDWKRLLSLIVELDRQREYSVESTDEIFKITVKK
jgi:outer membrane protein TolC